MSAGATYVSGEAKPQGTLGSMTWANEPPTEAEKARVAVQRELIRSAQSGSADRVRSALDECKKCVHGFDVDYASSARMTALNYACCHGDLESCRLLLAAGASVEASNSIGATPLLTAICNGHGSVVSMLLAKGANKHAALRDGRSAIALAREYAHFDIEKLVS